MGTNIPNSISSRAVKCLRILEQWAQVEVEGPRAAHADDALSLFRIWATNNFVFTNNKICLDWRLRDVLFLSTTIQDLLDELADTICDRILGTSGETESSAAEGAEIGSNAVPPETDYDCSESDEEIDDPLSTLDDIQRQLFEICGAIHRSGTLSRLSKLSVKFQANVLPETELFCSNFLSPLLTSRFRTADPSIIQRMVDTIALRRQNFVYLYQREERAAEPPSRHDTIPEQRTYPRLPTLQEDNEEPDSHEHQQDTSTKEPMDLPRNAPTDSRFGATTVKPDRVFNTPSVRSSAIGRVGDGSAFIDSLIPKPPLAIANTPFSKCPCCCLVYPVQEVTGSYWRRHFLQDLMPYVCLLEDCKSADALFGTPREWIDHMTNEHPIITWTCTNREHDEPQRSGSPSDLQLHLTKEHADEINYDIESLHGLINASRIVLPREEPLSDCPLCGDSLDTSVMTLVEILDHVAEHMIELAMYSLPDEMFVGGYGSDVATQSHQLSGTWVSDSGNLTSSSRQLGGEQSTNLSTRTMVVVDEPMSQDANDNFYGSVETDADPWSAREFWGGSRWKVNEPPDYKRLAAFQRKAPPTSDLMNASENSPWIRAMRRDSFVKYVYRGKIRDRLFNARVQSDWAERQSFFVPCTDFDEIIDEECVEGVFKDLVNINYPEGAEIVAQIYGRPGKWSRDQPSFRKVLATLIYIGKYQRILDFIKHRPPINDQVLPLHMVYNPKGRRCGLSLSSSRSVPIDFTTEWEIDDLQNFFDFQWSLYPIFFAVDGNKDDDNHKKRHYQCPAEAILPFVYQPTPSTTTELGLPNVRRAPYKDAFSTVTLHKLHPSQQNLRRYTTDGPNRLVAVKRLRHSSLVNQEERRMLATLTPLRTPHLAKLLGSFEIRNKFMTGATYYFMTEAADCNLQEFWCKSPTLVSESLGISATELARWVAQQCCGLARAMEVIHSYQDTSDSDPEQVKHGVRTHVKPSDILVYNSWVGHEHPLGILQFSSFGTRVTRDSHSYQPPESRLLIMKLTQSTDIWMLGCLFLEFVTWIIRGPQALDQFLEQRRSPGFRDNDTITTFYQVDEILRKTTFFLSESVLEWANDICQSHSVSQFICDFIVLIIMEMLVIENTGLSTSTSEMKLPKRSPTKLLATVVRNPDSSGKVLGETPNRVPAKRISSAKVAQALEKMIQQEDDYYVKPLDMDQKPKLGHSMDGTMQALTLQMTLKEVADISRQIILFEDVPEDTQDFR